MGHRTEFESSPLSIVTFVIVLLTAIYCFYSAPIWGNCEDYAGYYHKDGMEQAVAEANAILKTKGYSIKFRVTEDNGVRLVKQALTSQMSWTTSKICK